MSQRLTRRAALGTAGLLASTTLAAPRARAAAEQSNPFGFCLNTSTIREQNLGIVAEVDLAAEAGYGAIEPWIRELEAYVQAGGSLSDLRKRIADRGLKVVSAIGFAPWIVDDPQARAAGLEQARRDMNLVAAIGGNRIAAPPVGASKEPLGDLRAAAERYRALLEIGRLAGVKPQAEVWGHSKTLGRLSETMFVAIESGHPDACLLPDVYHLHRGGSEFTSLKLLGPAAIEVFHVNDYPARPEREKLTDADRVYPGDGVAPLGAILRDLAAKGGQVWLSLELFNRDYWKQDPKVVLATGLSKTQSAVSAALGT